MPSADALNIYARVENGNFMKTRKTYLDGIKQYGPLSDVVFRVLFSLIFIVGGLGQMSRR